MRTEGLVAKNNVLTAIVGGWAERFRLEPASLKGIRQLWLNLELSVEPGRIQRCGTRNGAEESVRTVA
jgi:hypothetical protein